MDTEDDFDFDASTDQAWALFAERLAEVVSVIDDGEQLAIGTPQTDDEPAGGITFTCLPRPSREVAPEILAQAVGSTDPARPHALAAQEQARLAELGWEVPGAQVANFSLRHVQDDCTWIAQQAVQALREVFGVQHPVFLAPDHLAEVLQPSGEAAHEVVAPDGLAVLDAHDLVATMPATRDQLDTMVSTELTHLFGHTPLRDEAGDYAIRVGSTMVFVRVVPDAKEVLLFSALVHDVEGRSRAAEVLNDLNTESRFGRFSIHRDRVYVTMSLLAQPFVPAHLHEGVRIISQIADGIDDDLAAKLRGRVTFTDRE